MTLSTICSILQALWCLLKPVRFGDILRCLSLTINKNKQQLRSYWSCKQLISLSRPDNFAQRLLTIWSWNDTSRYLPWFQPLRIVFANLMVPRFKIIFLVSLIRESQKYRISVNTDFKTYEILCALHYLHLHYIVYIV